MFLLVKTKKENLRENTKTENMGKKEREKRNWHSICLRIRLLHPRHDGGGEEVLADILLFEMMTIREVANRGALYKKFRFET